jgi:hypothetical protein
MECTIDVSFLHILRNKYKPCGVQSNHNYSKNCIIELLFTDIMLSREEQKAINTFFWNGFKEFTKKVKSSNGRRINWLSYPSDVNDVYIRLHADTRIIGVFFDIQPKDQGVREIIWEQMTELKKVMESTMNIKGEWMETLFLEDGRTISRISWTKSGLNYLNEDDRLEIYTFLRDTLKAFDNFYQEFKEILINLTD